jgi:hypothetical protein
MTRHGWKLNHATMVQFVDPAGANLRRSPDRCMRDNALSGGDLIAICEGASWMAERVTDVSLAVEGAEADAARARRLAEWKRVVAADSEQRFHRRLEWDGLNEADVSARAQ